MAGSAKREKGAPEAASKRTSGAVTASAQKPILDRVIQAQIGDKLRTMYGELVEQPVPDRLAKILEQLTNEPARKG